MTTGVVVGSILLAADQLLGMEKLLVGSGSNLVDHSRLQVNKDSARDVLASASFRKEGGERNGNWQNAGKSMFTRTFI